MRTKVETQSSRWDVERLVYENEFFMELQQETSAGDFSRFSWQ